MFKLNQSSISGNACWHTVEIPWSTDQTRFEESGLTRLYSCVCMQSLIFLENYALPLSFVFDLRLIGILVVKHIARQSSAGKTAVKTLGIYYVGHHLNFKTDGSWHVVS